MDCDDVLRAFEQDEVDLESVKRHLAGCPECASRLARDLEIEEALRDLHSGLGSVDLASEVRSAIVRLNAQRSKRNLIRTWTWITLGLAVFAVLIITMPELASWMNTAFHAVGEFVGPQSILFRPSPASASMQLSHLFLTVAAVLTWTVIHVWREAKAIHALRPRRERPFV